MLTENHLAVVRAALKYMNEEISPSGFEALIPYLDDRSRLTSVAIEDVEAAQDFFESTSLSYVLVDSTNSLILSERLVSKLSSDELTTESIRSSVAAVLVTLG